MITWLEGSRCCGNKVPSLAERDRAIAMSRFRISFPLPVHCVEVFLSKELPEGLSVGTMYIGGVDLERRPYFRVVADHKISVLRVAGDLPLDDPVGVAVLLGSLREAGTDEQVAVLAGRAAAHVPLDNPAGVAALLPRLREAGADEQVAVLAGRAAAHVRLDDPRGVADLLGSLREAGSDEQVAVLAGRAAAHVPLDNPVDAAVLLRSLRRVGADEQTAALICRLPAVGMCGLFLKYQASQDQFHFGLEADGTHAAAWDWEGLDL
jgi:hypothetical protein